MTEPVANPTVMPDDIEGGTVLAFLNEVAGGRKLLGRLRELSTPAPAASPSPRRRTSPSPGRSSTSARSATPR